MLNLTELPPLAWRSLLPLEARHLCVCAEPPKVVSKPFGVFTEPRLWARAVDDDAYGSAESTARMYVFRTLCSKSVAPLTLAAAGFVASSARFERPTEAEPVSIDPQASQQPKQDGEQGKSASAGGGESGKKQPLFPPPIGPMVAVYLDDTSVDKLRAHFPEARDGQLRKVVLQYGPSASEREMYRHLFSGKAEVTVTGDASSFARRALVASVSHAGKIVEPASLSATINISPPAITEPEAPAVAENDGPGPLASAVLIEQAKKAGATKEEMWEGTLPPLLAHHRQFPSEPGAYVRLKEPITVYGTICRADWVDGASNVCRDTLDGGQKREEDWEPSDCSICAFFSVSPCKGIFERFVATSKRRDEYLKTFETEQEADDEGDGIAEGEAGTMRETRGSTSETADARATSVERTSTQDGRHAGTGTAEGNARKKQNPTAGKEGNVTAVGNAAEAGRKRQADRDLIEEQLEKEALAIFQEMKECMIYHDLY